MVIRGHGGKVPESASLAQATRHIGPDSCSMEFVVFGERLAEDLSKNCGFRQQRVKVDAGDQNSDSSRSSNPSPARPS